MRALRAQISPLRWILRDHGLILQETVDQLMRTNRLLVAMGGISSVMGVLEPHLPTGAESVSPLVMPYTFIMAGLLFFWCKADAADRGIAVPLGAPLLVALIAIVGVPYYFFRTLPFRRALAAIGKALLFFLLLIALQGALTLLSAKLA